MKNNLFILAMLATLALGLTSCGPSEAMRGITEKATIEEVTGSLKWDALDNKLAWLQANAKSGGSYTIELSTNQIINGNLSFSETMRKTNRGNLYYKDRSDITITIKGIGENITISLPTSNDQAEIFEVFSGVTLILDNITLKGTGSTQVGPLAKRQTALVLVKGTLIMNDGSAIINNFNNYYKGGGVYVSGGGTFIMKGGNISGNICSPVLAITDCYSRNAYAAQKSGTGRGISKCEETCKGGGVYVSGGSSANLLLKASPSATFIKTGGTIAGYTGDKENGNEVRNLVINTETGELSPVTGEASQNNGHAIYFDALKGEGKGIDTTVGPEMNLTFKDGVLAEEISSLSTAPAVETPVPAAIPAPAEAAPVAPAAETPVSE